MTSLRHQIPLRRRKILKKSLGPTTIKLIVAVIVTLVFFWIYDLFASGEGRVAAGLRAKQFSIMWVWILCVFGWALSALIYEILYYVNYYYDIDENNVVIRKGVIVKKEITLAFSKITDVYVDQDALDVVFAIYDVHISTPTVASGEFAHIDGVDRKGATILRDMILERINKSAEEKEEVPEKKAIE